ncbi:hypothetical protein ACQCN2_08335 [Brevibacillus ginsengisoli]|uniref:hypothetical protein n=1 Tax=Brevibacillus ginsengisoli TaxID=363854 RepID=UPI003CF5EE61
MAQRLTTNYANAYFTMNERELNDFVQLFLDEHVTIQVKICDNGDRDIVIADRHGKIQLPFRHSEGRFICDSSYVIEDLSLANTMRKAMKAFKGHGIVHRVYENFTMVYHYDEGAVTRIEEVTDEAGLPVFEANQEVLHAARELEKVFCKTDTEQEIVLIRQEVDRLLDLRNWTQKVVPERISYIDQKLSQYSHRLFVLEA